MNPCRLVPPTGVSPLWLASGEGHLEVAKLLLSHKADPNNKRMDGISALMAACGGGYTLLLELLLGAGADANACVFPLPLSSLSHFFFRHNALLDTKYLSATRSSSPIAPLTHMCTCRRDKDGLTALLLSHRPLYSYVHVPPTQPRSGPCPSCNYW